jgi:hypothetical protein
MDDEEQSNKKPKKKKKTFLSEDIRCENAFFIFSQKNSLRKFCFKICIKNEHQFEQVIIATIIAGSLKLAGATFIRDDLKYTPGTIDYTFNQIDVYLDLIFNTVYFFEFFIKSITMGLYLDKNCYLSSAWNKLDFIIVLASASELITQLLAGGVSSLFDAGGPENEQNSTFAILKILRMLRILRPLRFISHNKNLRIIVNSLIGSMTGIFNVTIVIVLIFIMFSILGVFLFQNRLNYCFLEGLNPMGVTELACSKIIGARWKTRDFNFDNIGQGMISLFVFSSLEAWPTLMYHIIDG